MKGIGCCAPATKCFRPDVIHSVGVNSGYQKLLGLRQWRNPPLNNTSQIGSSWNLIAAGEKKKKNLTATYQSCDTFFFPFGGRWRRQCRQQCLTSTPVCDNGSWRMTAASGAGTPGGAASPSRQQLVPLRGVDTHFPSSSSSRQEPGATALTISLLSPTGLTAYLISASSQPSYLLAHTTLLFSFPYMYI